MKKIVIIIMLVLVLNLPSISVDALTIKLREDLSIDPSIYTLDEEGYANPVQILIAPIFIASGDNLVTEESWVKGVFYYTVDRLGFQDLPYHYLVTENGTVIKGNKAGEEKSIPVTNVGEDAVIIGYITKSSSANLDPRGERSLKETAGLVANSNSINPDRIIAKNLRFARNTATKNVEIIAEDLFGNWEATTKSIQDTVRANYSPTAKSYSVEVIETVIPTEEVNPGDELIASLKIKNTGQNGIYFGSNSEMILTKATGGTSAFYINNLWSSQTQTPIMEDGQDLLPGKELTFNFKIRAPLFVGPIGESFELKTLEGSKIQANNIEVTVNVRRSDKQIVEIKNNSAGFVNVYGQPYTSSGVVVRAAAGERYFLLEQNLQTLWAKIDLGNGQSGWLAIWNLSYL